MKPIAAIAMALALLMPLDQVSAERIVRGTEQYKVVINHEEQYSIWIVDRDLPEGWKPIGFVGTREQALRYIEEVWTDMRPLSARREMALKIYRELQKKRELQPKKE